MKGSKEFFMELREGEEYLSCLMTLEVYNGIDHELREKFGTDVIRQHSDRFKDDPVHKELVRKRAKINKEIINYEYDKNHGIR